VSVAPKKKVPSEEGEVKAPAANTATNTTAATVGMYVCMYVYMYVWGMLYTFIYILFVYVSFYYYCLYVASNVPRETSSSRFTRDTTSSRVRSTSVPKLRPSSNTATAAAVTGSNIKYPLPFIHTLHTHIHKFNHTYIYTSH
jgi:hypothetical protein